MFAFSVLVLTLCQLAVAKVAYYDWSIDWVSAAPDGFTRPVIGINGQWPPPEVHIDKGDRIIARVYNNLGNQSTGIHWHGIYQRGSQTMDGPSGISQCPIAPNGTFTYDFEVGMSNLLGRRLLRRAKVNQAGTYWYHSHNQGQYPDGLRAPLIVHDPTAPFAGKYDEEFTLTMTDWYHEQMPNLLHTFESASDPSTTNNAITAPIPDTGLLNDQVDTKFKMLPGKTYLVHMICPSNFAGVMIWFGGHNFTVVEVDGIYTQETQIGAKNIRLAPGQRWSFLIESKPDTSANYAIFATLDVNMIFPPLGIPYFGYASNFSGWLVYDETKPLPPVPVFPVFDFFDDLSLIPYDSEPILQPDHTIVMETGFQNIDGIARAVINNVTYLTQKVPSLYTAATVGAEYSSNPLVYGQVNPFVLNYGETVEIIVNNNHNNLHPWHIHGHDFQVVQRGDPDVGPFAGYYANISSTPLKRDTIMANKNSHLVIRFKADNPGVWAFHCHIEWHIDSGLMATLIEAPDYISRDVKISDDQIQVCKDYGMGYAGNAANNTQNPLDLTGSNTQVQQYAQG